MTSVDVPARAGARQWWGLAVLCLPTMLTAVDINVMFLALPRVSAELGAGSTSQLWIMDIYGFMIAGFVVTMGTLGDRVGRRRVLLSGAAAFIVASVLAAYAPTTWTLIVARALLGIAGATLVPSVLALIRTMFTDPKQMAAAMAGWGTSIMAGVVLGPVVGGMVLEAFWWGAIFLMAVPVMGLLLVTGRWLVPESHNPDAGRLDLVSVALSLLAILPLVFGLKELSRDGWQALPVAAIGAGACFAVIFVRRQRRLANPLLDLRLFERRALSVTALLALLLPAILAGLGLMAVLAMQVVVGLTPFEVALWLLVPSLSMIVLGNMAVGVARKVRPAYVLVAGSLLAAAGAVVLVQVDGAGVGPIVTGLVLIYVGGGSIGMLAPFLLMSSAPPERAGSVGGIASTVGECGTALGVAVLGLIGSAVYHAQVTVPDGLSVGLADRARESIAGAVTAAEQTPGQLGLDLLASAREALTGGLHVVAVIGAVALVGLAFLAGIGLRQVPPTGQAPADDHDDATAPHDAAVPAAA